MEKQYERFEAFRDGRITDIWKKDGIFKMEYHTTKMCYYAIEYVFSGNSVRPKIPEFTHGDVEYPILFKGIVAHLIKHFGDSIEEIYNDYYDLCKNKYEEAESLVRVISSDTLDAEFYQFHVLQEKTHTEITKRGYPYLSKDEIDYLKKYAKGYFEYIELNYPVKDKQSEAPQQINKQQPETLGKIITHENSNIIVEQIKVQYRNIKGKELKLLLLAMQELRLLPQERITSKFHRCCKKEFDWDIASYNAMNGYEYNEYSDKKTYMDMVDFLTAWKNKK